jgi:UDP-N-acetylmuramoylalanine--D-glutamate ligase
MVHPGKVKGCRFTVLGAARSGLAAARLLAKHGARVFVSESAPEKEKPDQSRELREAGIAAEFGGHSDRIFQAGAWVISPGIPVTQHLVREALNRKIPVWGELEVASWFCRAPVIAITGSNGKSTVTTLLGEVLREAGKQVIVAGNIGRPFSDFAEKVDPEGAAVLEVSSFQLETVETFHPFIGVLLNLTPDHLNRHGSMDAYGAAKARLFMNQTSRDYALYNGKDPLVKRCVETAMSRQWPFGLPPGEGGKAYVDRGSLILRTGEEEEEVLSVHDLGIRGEHNVSNALASALAARLTGVPADAIRRAFRRFRGLPHRMEPVVTIQGVEWINDSKATNVDSVWFALGSFKRPVILIAGGRDKDADFTRLKERVRERVKTVILIGEAAGKIARAWEGVVPMEKADSMKQAVELAGRISRHGDVVLLSPGCASFDMFRDFEERGDRFKKFVRGLDEA